MSFRRAGPAAIAGLILMAACNSGGGGSGGGVDPALSISLTLGNPAPTGSNVAWIDGSITAGELQSVEILARDISSPFDAYGFELAFDPSVARVVSAASGGYLSSCSGLAPVFASNAAGTPGANDTGSLVLSEALPGATPPGCTLAGSARLAIIIFRAQGGGTSNLTLDPCAGSDPNTATGSCFYRRVLSGTTPQLTLVPVDAVDHRAAALSVSGS